MNIVIVGCGNVGFETARRLCRDHRLLLINRRCPPDLRDFIRNEPRVSFAQADAMDWLSVEKAIDAASAPSERIDVLISTVGAAGDGSALENGRQFTEEFDLNFFGNLIPLKVALPRMISARSGRIVVISSTSGVHTYPGLGAYAPAKWALTNLCHTLRKELEPCGIAVDVVFPRTIRNQRSTSFLSSHGIEAREVADQISRLLGQKHSTDCFIPRRYALLRVLERACPRLLDMRAGLRRGRRGRFCRREADSVLLVGPSRQLGGELARLYATTARRLLLVGPDEHVLSDIREGVRSSGCAVEAACLDMGDDTAIAALRERMDHVDVLVNEIGAAAEGPIAEVPLDAFRRGLTRTFLRPAQLSIELLRRNGKPGKIINILSARACEGHSLYGCSSAGQAALWAFTRSLRRTLGNDTQIMEVMLDTSLRDSVSRSGNGESLIRRDGERDTGQPPNRADGIADVARKTAQQIHDAERQGREIVILPARYKARMYLGAISPKMFT